MNEIYDKDFLSDLRTFQKRVNKKKNQGKLCSYPEELKLIFPNRINYRYDGLTNTKIGKFWNKSFAFIGSVKRKYKKKPIL